MLKTKTIMSVLGLFVVAAVVWLLLNLWYVPSVGKYSCSYTPWFLGQGQAHADNGDSCPDTVEQAWDDSEWAADRYGDIKDEAKTAGWYFDERGKPTKIVSGDLKGEDTERARRVMRERGLPTAPGGSFPSAHHVEAKVAAMMYENDYRRGILVINNTPCGGDHGFGCRDAVSLMPAPGAILRLWYPEDGVLRHDDFVGR